MIAYLHHFPQENLIGTQYLHTPMAIDHSGCGYYSDRIYNMHGETKRFYIATFGYEKGWREHNTYDREIDRYTIHFVFSGRGHFNGHPVSAGQMFIAPQMQKYTLIQDVLEPLVFGWIALSGTELENQLSLLHLTDMPEISTFQNKEWIQQLFIDTIYTPHDEADLEMFMFSAFYNVLALSHIINRPSQPHQSTRADQYFSEIMSYINTHYSENISVSDIAKHIHLSPAYLRRICIEKSGKTTQELISQKRINVARSMLANSNASVSEIAFFVGFSGQPSFSKFFTQKCGVSPQDYRQQQIEIRQRNAENIHHTEHNWRVDERRRLENVAKIETPKGSDK